MYKKISTRVLAFLTAVVILLGYLPFNNSAIAADIDKLPEVQTFTVNKVNENKEPLPGAEFKFTKPDGTVLNGTTNTEGKVVFDGIDVVGDYKLTEVKAPEGYESDGEDMVIPIGKEFNLPSRKGKDVSDKVLAKLGEFNIIESHRKTANKEYVYPNESGGLKSRLDLVFEDVQKSDFESGDYFVIKYSDNVDLLGMNPSRDFSLSNSTGLIAVGEYDQENNTVTYKFTDYVDTFTLIDGMIDESIFIDRETVNKSTTENIKLTYNIGSQVIETQDFHVEYRENDPHKITDSMGNQSTLPFQAPLDEGVPSIGSAAYKIDYEGMTYKHLIYVNPIKNNKYTTRNTKLKFENNYPTRTNIASSGNAEVKIYKVPVDKKGDLMPYSYYLTDSMISQMTDETSKFTIKREHVANFTSYFEIDFKTVAPDDAYVIVVDGKLQTPALEGAETLADSRYDVRATMTFDGLAIKNPEGKTVNWDQFSKNSTILYTDSSSVARGNMEVTIINRKATEPEITKKINLTLTELEIGHEAPYNYDIITSVPGDIHRYKNFVITDTVDAKINVEDAKMITNPEAFEVTYVKQANGTTLVTATLKDFTKVEGVKEFHLQINANIKANEKAEWIDNKAELSYTNTAGTSGEKETEVVKVKPAFTKISVEKKWTPEAPEGAEVELELYANEVKASEATFLTASEYSEAFKTLVLNEGNGWKGEFINLPSKDNKDQEIVYSVKEVNFEGYTSEVTGDAASGFVITNTKTPETPEEPVKPELVDVKVTKVWEGKQQDSVIINLFDQNGLVQSIDLSSQTNWTYTFKGLPKQVEVNGQLIDAKYTVSEKIINSNVVYSTTIDGNQENGYVITNKEVVPVKYGIKLVKKDSNTNEVLQGAKFKLYRIIEGEKIDNRSRIEELNNDFSEINSRLESKKSEIELLKQEEVIKEEEIKSLEAEIESLDLELINLEKEILALEASDGVEKDSTVEVVYSPEGNDYFVTNEEGVIEVTNLEEGNYYFQEIEAPVGYSFDSDKKYKFNLSENPNIIEVYNEKIVVPQPEYNTISGVKKWVGDTESNRPNSIIIKLLNQDGVLYDSVKVTAETNWEFKFENVLTKDAEGNMYSYTIEEIVPKGYESKVEGFVVTNTLIPEEPETPPVTPEEPEKPGTPPVTPEKPITPPSTPKKPNNPNTGDYGVGYSALFMIGSMILLANFELRKKRFSEK